jgi:uncharacterized protein YeaO (DUF488 family)
MIQVKRTYDPPARGDGQRILVERLWPRGMKRETLAMDAWMKEVAPSTELRRWFGHQTERWDEFQRRYREELDANPGGWESILEAGQRGTVTLLYSAHDTLHNGALVLRDYLSERAQERSAKRRTPAQRHPSGTAGKRSGLRGRTHGGARTRAR